jgi:hypothetical protein
MQEEKIEFLSNNIIQLIENIYQSNKPKSTPSIVFFFWILNSLGKASLRVSIMLQRKILQLLSVAYYNMLIILRTQVKEAAEEKFKDYVLILREPPIQEFNILYFSPLYEGASWVEKAPKYLLKIAFSKDKKMSSFIVRELLKLERRFKKKEK